MEDTKPGYRDLQLAELNKLRKKRDSQEKNLQQLKDTIAEMEAVLGQGTGPGEFAVPVTDEVVEALAFLSKRSDNPKIAAGASQILSNIVDEWKPITEAPPSDDGTSK